MHPPSPWELSWHNLEKEALTIQIPLQAESYLQERHYTTTERERLAMVYALKKFIHYLLGSHFKMFTDHSALKYLVNKPVLGGNIYKWLLLFQEYDFEIIVKLGKLNVGPNHLSRLESGEEPISLEDFLPDAQLFSIQIVDDQI